jgi:hypothetical protein
VNTEASLFPSPSRFHLSSETTWNNSRS